MSHKDFNLAEEFEAYDKMWEWVDQSGKNISLNKAPAANTQTNSKQYYMWSMYIPNSLRYSKGDWTSADLNRNGEFEGVVFATEELALDYGWDHLQELDDEDELDGFDPDDFTIDTIVVSGKVGPHTSLIEWLDSKGNKITTSGSSNSATTTKLPFGGFEPYFKKLIAYFQKYLTTDIICCNQQALSLQFPKTGNQLGLRILQIPLNNYVFCTIFDGSNNDAILAHSPQFKTWDQVLDWLIGQGLISSTDRKLCEAKLDGTPTKKELKTPVEDYFAEITESRAAAINFIKNKLAPRIKIKQGKYADISTSYTQVVAKETSGNHHEIGINPEYNYKAFTAKTSQFGIYPKDILHYVKTGQLVCTMPITESCKFNFTKEDLDAALDKLTDDDEQGLELGDNSENSDVRYVAGEPYGGTRWYVDKWADNLYIVTSELWGQDGGGPEEGVYEELDSIEEVWDYLSKLDQLIGIPVLRPKKPESPKPDPEDTTSLTKWVDQQGNKVTATNGPTLYTMPDDSCDGCGCVVDGVYSDFYEPYKLLNGHKLCETCLEGWIKLPKGFVDKFILISNYDTMDGEIDGFIEKLKLDQQDIDNMINEWNKRKQAGTLEISQQEIDTIENDFCNSALFLSLTANKADFM